VKRTAVIALAMGVALGLAGLVVVWWWYGSLDDFSDTPFGSAEEKLVEIAPGARIKEVASQLERAGVVCDALRFEWLVKKQKRERQLKTGEYGFAGPMLPEKVLEIVTSGRVKLYSCTIPEGLRMDEIAPLLEGCRFGPAADLLKLCHDEGFARQLGITGATLEGYLFPETYRFPKNPRPEAVLKKMVEGFFEALKRAQARQRPEVHLDAHETATLASIIEKETGAAEERPHISCVFHNRLRKNMRLETDPTVIYAKILRTGSFDGVIRREDLEYPHPYNTYRVKGLPPGPIANPGEAALEAALAPVDCDDLFFVACGGGTHRFCPDFDCHKKNVDHCQLGKP
jgi:UPF0755 protein